MNIMSSRRNEEAKLLHQAVKQNGMSLQYIPKILRTFELCKIAVMQNNNARQFVCETFNELI